MTQTNEIQSTEVVKYNGRAPIGTANGLKSLMEKSKDSIAQMLPKHISPERLFKTMLVAANRNPEILLCTQSSIMETINRAAELGLDLSGTLGECYPVPFNNKIKYRDERGAEREEWVKQCQLIIGYRGLAKLARQSGEVATIEADVVCENDFFKMTKGTGGECRFEACFTGPRGRAVGAFAYVRFKDGGEQYDFMPYDDIEKIRRVSKAGSDKQGNAIGPWKAHWNEMAKKTIFKRVAKWLPLSTEKFVRAIEVDGEELDLSHVLEAKTAAASAAGGGTAAVLDRVKGGNQPKELIDESGGYQDSGQQDDPGVDYSSVDTGEGSKALQEPKGQPEGQPLTPSASQQAPSQGKARPKVLTLDDMTAELEMAAQDAGLSPDEMHGRVAAWLKLKGQTPDKLIAKTTAREREGLIDAIRSKKLAADGSIMV